MPRPAPPYRRVYKPASAARCREPPFRHAPSLRLRRCGCLPSVTFRASLSSIRRSARRAIRASRCRSTPARSSVAGCRIPMPSRVPYSRPGSRFCGRFPPGHPRRSARCAPRPVRRPPCLRRVYAREPCRKAVRTALAQRCARPRRKGSPVFPGPVRGADIRRRVRARRGGTRRWPGRSCPRASSARRNCRAAIRPCRSIFPK